MLKLDVKSVKLYMSGSPNSIRYTNYVVNLASFLLQIFYMTVFSHLQVVVPRSGALTGIRCAYFAGIVAALCCANEVLAGPIMPRVVIASPIQPDPVTAIAPSYRSFTARLAAGGDVVGGEEVGGEEVGLKSDSGSPVAVMTIDEAAVSSGAVAKPEPVSVIAMRPQNADVSDSNRIFQARVISELSEFAFPRPERESRLFDELYLYFPVAGEVTAEVSVVGGALNGAVFAPPRRNDRSSNAIFSEVE